MAGRSVSRGEGEERPAGGRLRAVEKVERDRRVVIDRNRGLSWPEVARRNGLEERQARRVYAEWREEELEAFAEFDALDAAMEMLARYEAIESELALTAAEAKQDSVRVGALRTQADVMERRLALQQAVGLLPRRLHGLDTARDMRDVATGILGVMDEYELPDEATEKIIQFLRERQIRLGRRRG